MKKCCKNIDVTNPKTIMPFIADCLHRHKRRRDFRREISRNGITEDYYERLLTGAPIDSVAPVDMMGYVVYRNGKVRIRAKTFIHARRMALRINRSGSATLTQAQRLTSYKGCFLHSNCYGAWRKYKLEKAFMSAQTVISNYERSKTHVSLLRQQTRKSQI